MEGDGLTASPPAAQRRAQMRSSVPKERRCWVPYTPLPSSPESQAAVGSSSSDSSSVYLLAGHTGVCGVGVAGWRSSAFIPV